jgi:hypothetical protein
MSPFSLWVAGAMMVPPKPADVFAAGYSRLDGQFDFKMRCTCVGVKSDP